MLTPQFLLPIARELVIDLFAGGGGASTGIEQAIGRHVDIAINHDPEAVALHQANHPQTLHYVSDVFEVDPAAVTDGRPVGLLWASPDCKHFSKAKGGKPVSKKIRSLAWVVVKWAGKVLPRIICLENVEEFQTWGPLGADQRPCPRRKGRTFRRWVGQLRGLGYTVDWRELRACDYGAPTIRKRLFLMARRDGAPITWPEATHGAPDSLPVRQKKLQPWRTAADCIDFSIPCPSIFERDRPLAEATLRRIAKGVMRYVIDAPEPFIVPMTHTGGDRVHGLREPLRTITTAKRGELALAVPTLIGMGHGEAPGQQPRVPGLGKPLGTITAGGRHHGLVAAFLAQYNNHSGVDPHAGRPARAPFSTVTAAGSQQALVASNLIKLRGTSKGAQSMADPLHTVSAQGTHHAEVRAFLVKYFGTDQDPRLEAPMHTVTTKHRFGLVMVHGEPYAIADIGLRMLTPRELYRAQGFPYSAASRTLQTCLASRDSNSATAKFAPSHSIVESSRGSNEPAAVRVRIGFGRMDLEILSREKCLSFAQSAASSSSSPLPTAIADIARRLAQDKSSVGQGRRNGRAGQPRDGRSSTPGLSGAAPAMKSGSVTMPPAADVGGGTSTATTSITSTISPDTRGSQNYDSLWTTLYSYVGRAISSSIRAETPEQCSFGVELIVEDGYAISEGVDPFTGQRFALTKTAQVRMCGNSVCPPMAAALVAANYREQVVLEEAA